MVDLDALEKAGLFAQYPEAARAPADFYHVMDVPGLGEVGGSWDLRANLDVYLGRTSYAGKIVLDIGASDGFLAFEMEKRGARVVSIDLPIDGVSDVFPLAREVENAPFAPNLLLRRREAFWIGHRAFGSSVRLHESHAGRLDPRLTGFDVAIIGNVLQHLRDPTGVLLDVSTRARTIVITEADWLAGTQDARPVMTLFTEHLKLGNRGSWYMVSPQLVEDILSLTGLTIEGRDIHDRPFTNAAGDTHPVRHYTITATRQDAPAP
jgi:SAM-dependent methyltransferase